MTREEKILKARDLRAKGWTAPQIAQVVDAPESTVRNWYLGGTCSCGRPTDGGSGKKSGACAECYAKRKDERNKRIEEMWRAGIPGWQIAESVGETEVVVLGWVEKARRRQGRDLPLHRLGGSAQTHLRRAKAA